MTLSTALSPAALPAPAAELLTAITTTRPRLRAADDVTTRRTSAAALAAALAANSAAWTDLVEYRIAVRGRSSKARRLGVA